MNQENPYAAPQTIDLIDRQGDAILSRVLGSPRDFRWFRLGAIVWLVGLGAFVVAICLENRGWLLALVPIFLVGTILLDCIPPYAPGRGWLGLSVLLQLVSPIIVLLAIEDLPNPHWGRIAWYQRLGFWGEIMALFCVLMGILRIASWCHCSLLRWSALIAMGFLGVSIIFDVWFRSQQGMDLAIVAQGFIFFFIGVLPALLSLGVCFIDALRVPKYVGRSYAPPYNPRELPDVICLPSDSSSEKSP